MILKLGEICVNRRYKELDSLRGIAAMTVFLFHIAMVLPESWREGVVWKIIYFSPLRFFVNGEQPVILFFVLSGFVLSLVFFSGKEISYVSFASKRVFRLYIPYITAIIFAMMLFLLFSKGGNESLGDLFNRLWVDPINTNIVMNHFLFLGNYNIYSFNVVIWSLIHEMRISFILPLLVLLAVRFSWKVNLAVGFGLAVIGAGIHLVFQELYQPVYKTLFYILMFIVGILLSKNRVYLIEKFKSFTTRSKVILTIIGAVLYIYADFLGNPLLTDWVTTIGVSALLIISLSSTLASKVLLWRPFQFLGEISYSLYLYHLPILLSLFYVFYGRLPLLVIAGMSIIMTIIVSRVAWKIIEKPSIKIANTFSNKLAIKPLAPVLKEKNEMGK